MSEPIDILRAAPWCQFHKRTPVEGGFRYDVIRIDGPADDGGRTMVHPPMVGDDIFLAGGGWCTVVARSWAYAEYGSRQWPHRERYPLRGPMLQILVEEMVGGMFADQVVDGEDEAESEAG